MQPDFLVKRSTLSYRIGPIISELLLALLPMMTFYFIVFPLLPEQVAIHFDENGEANRFVNKNSMEVLIVFGYTGLLGFLVAKIIRFFSLLVLHFGSNENNMNICMRITNYLEFFIIAAFSMISLSIQWSSLGNDINETTSFMMKAMFIGINVLFMIFGNISPKIAPNKCFGIKTPYAFSSKEAWVQVQRFGGKLFFWGGLFNILINLFLTSKSNVLHVFNVTSIILLTVIVLVWTPGRNRTGTSA